MLPEKQEFAERVRRIQEARTAVGDARPPRDGGPRPQSRNAGGGSGKLILVIAVGLCGLAGGAVALSSIRHLGTAIGNAVQPAAFRQDSTADGSRVAGSDAPTATGALDQWFAGLTGPASEAAAHDPVDFLPPAPDGWFRVNTIDAQAPDALGTLQAGWPQPAPGIMPMEDHPGFAQLQQYLAVRQTPDMEQRALAASQTAAIYLHPDGGFLNVGLSFQSERGALGQAGDASSWIDALAERLDRQRESDEVLERLRLGGLDVINRTQAEGSSPVSGPIGADLDVLKGFRLAVPLTHRAVLEIQGIAAPNVADALIGAMDRDALMARLP